MSVKSPLWARLESAFSGRRVFLTGHTGFKGSWLALWLSQLGAEVTGYSLAPPTNPSNFVASKVEERLAAHIIGDVRDFATLENAVAQAKPNFVFHLAAQPIVRQGYAEPLDTLETNIMGTANLLEAVRRRETPLVAVVVTSDKCYENIHHEWGYRECDRLGGSDPYSASKAAAELVTSAYRRSFFEPSKMARHGIRLATARAGNVIGGGDWAADRILTDVVLSLIHERPVELRHPAAVRPWQHVLDSLAGYLCLAAEMWHTSEPALCDAWNFGPMPNASVTVEKLVSLMVEAWGAGRYQSAQRLDDPREAAVLRLAIDKSLNRLPWRPRLTLEHAVRDTAAWYRIFYEDPQACAMQAICLEEIERYFSS